MTSSFMQSRPPRRREPDAAHFAELSVVVLTHAIDIEGRSLPQGARGTVVAGYGDGVGYEVEFERPIHAVVTLDAGDLTA